MAVGGGAERRVSAGMCVARSSTIRPRPHRSGNLFLFPFGTSAPHPRFFRKGRKGIDVIRSTMSRRLFSDEAAGRRVRLLRELLHDFSVNRRCDYRFPAFPFSLPQEKRVKISPLVSRTFHRLETPSQRRIPPLRGDERPTCASGAKFPNRERKAKRRKVVSTTKRDRKVIRAEATSNPRN